MKKHIQFFALLIALFATTGLFAQSAGKVSTHDISFSADDMTQWEVKRLPDNAPDGRHVLATSKTQGQFIIVLRGGKIAQVGHIPVRGSYKALTPASTPCSSSGPCLSFQIKHCFMLPGGGCACVCGAWITSYPGN